MPAPALGLGVWLDNLYAADLADWLTVTAYLLAALLAWRAAGASGAATPAGERRFWRGCAMLLVAFGINEVFDFQLLLLLAGRAWALDMGYYEQRRLIQAIFLAVLVIGATAAMLGALAVARRAPGSVRLAIAGLLFICTFVLLRAGAFHHADALLGMGPEQFNVGAIQEVAGIAIVALAAAAYARRRGRA
jgi:hypothetical protein